MDDRTVENCRILVVEDEFLLAEELRGELDDAGAVVLGPVGTLEGAIQLVEQEQHIDGAILDVNLGGEMIYPVADLLLSRGTPFVFATGYDASAIPARFQQIERCDKPIAITKVTRSLGRVVSDEVR